MSQVVSIRLRDDQVARLKRFARRFGRSQSEMGAQFIEESMREAEFALIEFRDSPAGRQAYMRDSGLAVWEVIFVGHSYDDDVSATAMHFERPSAWAKAAYNYYEEFPQEIDQAIDDNDLGFDVLKRQLPGARLFEVTASSPRE